MEITDYQFGRIEIGGEPFNSDIIIFPDRVQDKWWRKEGHSLHTDDLTEIIEFAPDVLVLGTGYYNQMKIPDSTRRWLEDRGVKVVSDKTTEAVKKFNALQKQSARVVAALHLTC
ncbi:MAG: Mth938-like domain-containing protein [Gammaproteobacteria bacterium]|nr:MAG: Mth938-like domain-containing protein [Gammaproteobacteria bacterium]